MNFASVLVSLCLLSAASAYISIPFYSSQITADKPEIGMYGVFDVGMPAQKVKAYLYLRPLPHSPVFKKNPQCTDGTFDWNGSRTFGLYGIKADPQSTQQKQVFGYDTIYLPNAPRPSYQTNMTVQEGADCTYGAMSFGRSNENWSFIRDYLKAQRNPVAIFAFKEVGNNEKEKITGSLVMADYGKDVCENDWIYTATVPNSEIGEDWGIKIDRVDVGKFSKVGKANVSFKGITFGFGVPSDVFGDIKRVLSVDRNNRLLCNIRTQIKLQLGRKTLNIEPEVYADLSTRDRRGRCLSRVYDFGQLYHMPITFFRGKCQLLNYQTGQVAFATSKLAVERKPEQKPKRKPTKKAGCTREFLQSLMDDFRHRQDFQFCKKTFEERCGKMEDAIANGFPGPEFFNRQNVYVSNRRSNRRNRSGGFPWGF